MFSLPPIWTRGLAALASCLAITAHAAGSAQTNPIAGLEPVPPTAADTEHWFLALDAPAPGTETTSAATQTHRQAVLALRGSKTATATDLATAWCELAGVEIGNPYVAVAATACARWLAPVAAAAMPDDELVTLYAGLWLQARLAGDTASARQVLLKAWRAGRGGRDKVWTRWVEAATRDTQHVLPTPHHAALAVVERDPKRRPKLESWLRHQKAEADTAAAIITRELKRCAAADKDACARAAHLQIVFPDAVTSPEKVPELRELAYAQLEQLCTSGTDLACESLVRLRRDRSEHPMTGAEALTALRRACVHGLASSCVNAALALARGKGVDVDEPAARVLFRRACQLGIAEGCTGVSYYLHRGDDDAHRAALILAALACRGGDPMACAHVSNAYVTGVGLAKDSDRALAYAVLGCVPTASNVFACQLVAASAAVGEAALSHPDLAANVGDRAFQNLTAESCAEKPSASCAMWDVTRIASGSLARTDPKAAVSLDAMCAKDWQPACRWRKQLLGPLP